MDDDANTNANTWKKSYKALCGYHSMFGNCLVLPPPNGEGEDSYDTYRNLVQWVTHQRRSEDQLSRDQKQALDELHFFQDWHGKPLPPPEYHKDAANHRPTIVSQELVAFTNTDVSQPPTSTTTTESAPEKTVGTTPSVAIRNKVKDPTKNTKEPDTDHNNIWDETLYAQLVHYQKQWGHCRVLCLPDSTKQDPDGDTSLHLSAWVNKLRQYHDTLPPQYIQTLKTLGFWDDWGGATTPKKH